MNEHRRALLGALAGAGALGFGGLSRAAAEPPPEVSTLRVVKFPSVCQAPVYLAEELLRAEGFTGFTFVDPDVPGAGPGSVEVMNKGLADMAVFFAAPL